MDFTKVKKCEDSGIVSDVDRTWNDSGAPSQPLLSAHPSLIAQREGDEAAVGQQLRKPILEHPTSLPILAAKSWEDRFVILPASKNTRENRPMERFCEISSKGDHSRFADRSRNPFEEEFRRRVAMQERRKLSESRGVKLPIINITSPSVRSRYALPVSSGGASEEKSNPKQVKYADLQDASTSQLSSPTQGSPPLTSSPVGYTLRHSGALMVDTSARAVPQLDTPPHVRLSDLIDITIFLADRRGFKFSLVGGKVASAETLLSMMADHFGIDDDVMVESCSLWMVSDLLEVQLKPHHVPCEVLRCWTHLLKKFTCAEREEMETDVPLLMLKRNVLLDVLRERELDNENERLTEILYANAKDEVLSGRYVCNLEMSIHLAALQMAIELGPYDSAEHTPDVISEGLHLYFPVQHRHTVKTVYLFGFPVIGCKGVESDIVEEFRTVSLKYDSNHAKRVAYLEIVRSLPFYGAAFFRGQVERPPAGSIKEFKKMFLAATMPDIQVLVGVNREFCTVIDAAKHELLLCQSLYDCSWRRVDIGKPTEEVTPSTKAIGLPCFLLHFPDEGEHGDRVTNMLSGSVEQPERSKLLQVFSRQAVMIDALMTALYKIALLEAQQMESFEGETGEVEEDADGIHMDDLADKPASIVTAHVRNSSSSTDDGAPSAKKNNNLENDSSKGTEKGTSRRRRTTPGSSTEEMDTSEPAQHSPPVRSSYRAGSPCMFANNFSKLCLATFDAAGRCVEAQGSLRRVLQEVS